MFKVLGQWLKQAFGSSKLGKPATTSIQQSETNGQLKEPFDSIDAVSHLVPYDENLLERARTQWQFGDWHNLAKLDRETLQHHPERAKLVLLAAAGRLQMGQDSEARQYIQLAQSWGCSKKHISQILISGVHNTIGMASAIVAQSQRASLHFEKAIIVGSPNSDISLLTQARTAYQVSYFDQIGLSTPIQLTQTHTQANLSSQYSNYLKIFKKFESQINSASTHKTNFSFKVQQIAAFDLGQAWASNTINTVIFRHHGVMTWGDYQYTAFYLDETTLRVVRRTLTNSHISTHDLLGQYNLRDAHNSISMGVDRAGHLHISYDHHATKLRYRRSSKPNAIDYWTDELAMTGANEDRVTYPTFILPRGGHPLTMLYRDGVHNKGSARLKTYDEHTQSWSDRSAAILSGADQKPWTSNAYWNHPAIGSNGTLHLSFVWRTDTIGEQKLVNNVNIGYAWSPDNGLSWFTSRGLPCKLPMTQVNAETVWPVSPGSNLINQTSMALDSHNRPHIAFYANDKYGVPQYQHIWFDGEVWHQQYFSARTQAFNLQGGGTLQIPISRPEILIDKQDCVYAVYRGDLTENCMVVTQIMGAKCRLMTTDTASRTKQLWPEPLDYAEPVIDRNRWAEGQVLSLLLQRTQQPNGDLPNKPTTEPVWLVDFSLSS